MSRSATARPTGSISAAKARSSRCHARGARPVQTLLEDPAVLKIVQNAKFDMVVLSRYGISLEGFDDPCLMSYALDAGHAEHLPEQLAGTLLS